MTETNQHLDRFDARARLGEGPVWDDAARLLYWIDIYNHRVHQFDPATRRDRIFEVRDVVGFVALTEDAKLLIGLRNQLAYLDPGTGDLVRLDAVVEDRPGRRLNDGKPDPQGRCWVGSMSPQEPGEASLFRVDRGVVRIAERGLTIANGLGWSPDQRTFYHTDSPRKVIYAYDFHAEEGRIENRRVFADLSAGDAFPDGLAVDAEGCVWSAQWDGWCVIRFAPDGREVQRVALPVQRPTSCTFGGPDLRTLFVTSASVGLSEEQIQASFHSGDLFWLDAGVAGLPANRYRG